MHPRRRVGTIFWLVMLVAATVTLLWLRRDIEQSHVVLTLLLVVIGGSVAGGRALGFTMACLAFGLIDYFFQAPFDQMSVSKPLDWVVLIAFVAIAGAATDLLARARREAEVARQRTSELDSLSRVGADTLRFADPADALHRITTLVRATLDARACSIHMAGDDGAISGLRIDDAPGEDTLRSQSQQPAALAARERMVVTVSSLHGPQSHELTSFVERGTPGGHVTLLAIPLLAEQRVLGVLSVADPSGLRLDDPRRRFLVALAYYAALGVERVSLVADAERLRVLRDSHRTKDEIVAAVSHDLRTPLTTIRLLAQEPGIASHPNAVAIVEEADRLTRMVTDVLELSRLRAGGYRVQAEINTAEDVIGATMRQVRGSQHGRRIVRNLDLTSPALAGIFDFVLTIRILGNLVENAIRFSPIEQPIELGARREADALIFTVCDRGPGIAQTEQQRIFEAFYRPKDQPLDTGHAGLGLSIARTLADLQNGSLSYASREGGGSCFTLRLPAVDAGLKEAE